MCFAIFGDWMQNNGRYIDISHLVLQRPWMCHPEFAKSYVTDLADFEWMT